MSKSNSKATLDVPAHIVRPMTFAARRQANGPALLSATLHLSNQAGGR